MKNLSKFIFAVTVLVTGGVSAQNVGIGTAVPTEKLHVQGGARVTSLSGVGNRLVQSNATGVLSNFPIGINDQILTMVGGIPIWQDPFPAGANGQIWTLVGGTWQWLDPQVDNGLYYNAGAQKTRLGGPLVEQTTITHNGNHLIHNLNGTGDFMINASGLPHFETRDNGISFFGGDVFWRQTSTNGTNLMVLTDDVGSGRLRIYEGGGIGVDLDANTQYVFNELGNDRNFRIETNNNQNLFFVDAGLDVLGITQPPAPPYLLGAGTPVHTMQYPIEIGWDANSGDQLHIGYYNGSDPMIHPERTMAAWGWGYSGTAARPWWFVYTDNLSIVSQRKTKRDIVSVSKDEALEAYVMNDIINLDADFYKKKGDLDELIPGLEGRYRPHMQIGYMLDEVPDYACDASFSGINPYALTTMGLIGVKFNYKEINKIKEVIGAGTKINDFGSQALNSTELWVNFDQDFSDKLNGNPVVTITSNNPIVVLSIVEKSNKGFKVVASEAVSGLSFDWIAMGKSKGSTMKEAALQIDPVLREKLEISDAEREVIFNRQKAMTGTLGIDEEAVKTLNRIGNDQ